MRTVTDRSGRLTAALTAALLATLLALVGGMPPRAGAVPAAAPGAAPGPAPGSAPAAAPAATRAAAALPGRITALTWNICGASKTACADRDLYQPQAKIDEIKRQVDADATIDVIMLQEACGLHAELLQQTLGAGWVVHHRAAREIGTDRVFACDADNGTTSAGTVIAMRKLPGAKPVAWDMTFPAAENDLGATRERDFHTQGAACIQDRANMLLACTSHFASGKHPEYRRVSAQAFAQQARDWQNGGYRTVLGGDFNLTPHKENDAIQPLYRGNFESSGGGSREATHPTGKIDYLFFSDYGWDLVGNHVHHPDSKLSDHYILTGTVTPSSDPIPAPEGTSHPIDAPPTTDAGPDAHGSEGSAVHLHGSVGDDHGRAAARWTYDPGPDVDPGTTCRFGAPAAPASSFTCTDDGTFTVTLTADDGVNRPVSDTATVHLRNVAPTLKVSGAEPWSVHRAGSSTPVRATFTDPGSNDTHTCRVGWDHGGRSSSFPASGGSCRGTHAFGDPGMYDVGLSVTDDDGGRDRASVMTVVYDPAAGLAADVGTLASPRGAQAGSQHTGQARFAVLAKYLTTDATRPWGRVTFGVPGAGTTLASTELDWLVITPDGRVAVKGTGRVNGTSGYGFLAYAVDGRFRMVVWPLSHGRIPPDAPLYDNRRGSGYDLDAADPQPVTSDLAVVDSGWVPGLPPLDGDLGRALRDYLQREPKRLGVQTTLPLGSPAAPRATTAPDGVRGNGSQAHPPAAPTPPLPPVRLDLGLSGLLDGLG
jgi:endonuclease/exonuclease/phosphatase family metal-dependent hydrolase